MLTTSDDSGMNKTGKAASSLSSSAAYRLSSLRALSGLFSEQLLHGEEEASEIQGL